MLIHADAIRRLTDVPPQEKTYTLLDGGPWSVMAADGAG